MEGIANAVPVADKGVQLMQGSWQTSGSWGMLRGARNNGKGTKNGDAPAGNSIALCLGRRNTMASLPGRWPGVTGGQATGGGGQC